MTGDADVAHVGALLADKTRATMCMALLDGRFRTAGELARVAGVAPSTASEHLRRLLCGGLLEDDRNGRHRYFRLAGPDVAHAIEALAVVAPAQPVLSMRGAAVGEAIRSGRTCHDHLAGRLGVELTDALVRAGVLTPDFALANPEPLSPLALRVRPAANRPANRPLVRPCVDWTERRHHVAGELPAAMAVRLFELGWLERFGTDRAVRLTAPGDEGLQRLLGWKSTCRS